MTFYEKIMDFFPSGYWHEWHVMFGHDFLAAHLMRTAEYQMDFIYSDFKYKDILEIGGFPGLAMATYKMNGCNSVTAIDSPDYRPKWYLEFCEIHGIPSIPHDINRGKLDLPRKYDIAVMSDVLMHNSGFPSDFIKGVLEDCRLFYMLNYRGTDGNINPPSIHNLHAGFPIPDKLKIIKAVEALGAECIEFMLTGEGRELLIFESKIYDMGSPRILPLQAGGDSNSLRSSGVTEQNSNDGSFYTAGHNST